MQNFLKAVAIFLLTASAPLATLAQTSNLSKAAGRYVAGAYQGITNSVIGGPHATGTVNIQLAHPWIETPDGRTPCCHWFSWPLSLWLGPRRNIRKKVKPKPAITIRRAGSAE